MSEIIYAWIKTGLIKTDSQKALEMAEQRASSTDWLVFSKRLLVLFGLLSLAFGVIFFFAYNWNEMGRMVKFMALQLLLVVVFLLYILKPKSTWTSQALLLSAVLILGALLALFGQTYQTGADPWQLFATWALLILPVVVFSRSEVLWIFLAVLLNLALILYLQVNRSLFGLMFAGHQLPWVFLLLNGGLTWMLEWLSSQTSAGLMDLRHRWAAQLVGLIVLYILTWMGLQVVWGRSADQGLNLLLFIIFMSGAFAFYRFIRKDLLLLTAWMLGVIIFILAVLANTVFDSFDAGGLLLMAICLIGMTTLAVSWIKKIHEVFKQEVSS